MARNNSNTDLLLVKGKKKVDGRAAHLAKVRKPFKANNPITGEKDTRINRNGRIKPKSQKELEDLLDKLFDEESDYLPDTGEIATRLEALLVRMMKHKNPAAQIHLLERRFGKVKETLDLNLNQNVTNVITIIDDSTDTSNAIDVEENG